MGGGVPDPNPHWLLLFPYHTCACNVAAASLLVLVVPFFLQHGRKVFRVELGKM
jgi:hypothetical protein